MHDAPAVKIVTQSDGSFAAYVGEPVASNLAAVVIVEPAGGATIRIRNARLKQVPIKKRSWPCSQSALDEINRVFTPRSGDVQDD